jgi:hypothetical protein
MKLGMYIMAPEPISMAYFITLPISLCLLVYPTIVARQRFRKNVTVAKYTHVIIKELFDASFYSYIRSVSYQR